MKIVLKNLTKKFPGPIRRAREEVVAVNDFDFEIPDGQLVSLLGPSGCGKSTALNLICGLIKPTSGKIFLAMRMLPTCRLKIAAWVWCFRTMRCIRT